MLHFAKGLVFFFCSHDFCFVCPAFTQPLSIQVFEEHQQAWCGHISPEAGLSLPTTPVTTRKTFFYDEGSDFYLSSDDDFISAEDERVETCAASSVRHQPVQLSSPTLHRHFRLQRSAPGLPKRLSRGKGFVPIENVATWWPPARGRAPPVSTLKSPRRALADISTVAQSSSPSRVKRKKRCDSHSSGDMDCAELPDVPKIGFLHTFVGSSPSANRLKQWSGTPMSHSVRGSMAPAGQENRPV